ncbi:MAG TPA: GFA family protein [Devosiaceae bacterium]|nr:GFA family protein [Devosiaceae bacterium]
MRRIDLELSGGCQCGAVRYHTTQILDNAHICHCRMCQKAMGNFFAPLVGMPLDRFEWTRGAPSVFESSKGVERGFCANCGTPLFYNNTATERIGMTIGSLDEPERVMPLHQYGIEARLSYFAHLHELEGELTTEEDDPSFARAVAARNHQHPDRDTQTWTVGGRAGDG